MSKETEIQQQQNIILAQLSHFESPVGLGEIEKTLDFSIHKKTIQRRLKTLVEEHRVFTEGKGRQQKYYTLPLERQDKTAQSRLVKDNTFSAIKTETLVKDNTFSAIKTETLVKDKNSNLVNGKYRYQDAMAASIKTGYFIEDKISEPTAPDNPDKDNNQSIFSAEMRSLLAYLDVPSYGRTKSTYQRRLLDDYRPNETQYVPDKVRQGLLAMGKRVDIDLAAGTYAKQIGQRLLIDLSYHSSRLEGNTYSKLDTQYLIESGRSAEGKIQQETVMIINHKEAIIFLVENAEALTLTPFTVRNIHYLLSQDLLHNPNACGNVRQIEVGIGKSAYLPLNNSHQLTQHLDVLLRKAAQIKDPFEQSFFLLMHISYLQAFEDVNKRTARLTCNIPFIKSNLCPLSFIDVPQEDYFAVLLYFYETNDLRPALALFQWAYRRSCEQYEVVKASLGEIDSYRIQYRGARKEAMGAVIRKQLTGDEVEPFLVNYCQQHGILSAEKFIAMTREELTNLHVGAIIGLGITEKMFISWQGMQAD